MWNKRKHKTKVTADMIKQKTIWIMYGVFSQDKKSELHKDK